MTAEIHTFETPEMAGDRTQREIRACETEVAANCQARLTQEDMDYRTRLENELVLAIASGDLEAADSLNAKLEKLAATGMRVVE